MPIGYPVGAFEIPLQSSNHRRYRSSQELESLSTGQIWIGDLYVEAMLSLRKSTLDLRIHVKIVETGATRIRAHYAQEFLGSLVRHTKSICGPSDDSIKPYQPRQSSHILKPTQQTRWHEMADITRDELHIEAAVKGEEGLKCKKTKS